jgi:hypothetical protein
LNDTAGRCATSSACTPSAGSGSTGSGCVSRIRRNCEKRTGSAARELAGRIVSTPSSGLNSTIRPAVTWPFMPSISQASGAAEGRGPG